MKGQPVLGTDRIVLKSSSRLARLARHPLPTSRIASDRRTFLSRYGAASWDCGGEGVITLAGVEHCFMYLVQNDVVDTVIGPPDYIEQVFNEGRQDMQEGQSPLPRKDHD